MDSKLNDSVCVVCGTGLDSNSVNGPMRAVRQKGKDTLLDCSIKKADQQLIDYLQSNPAIVNAHDRCYRIYTTKRLLARSNSEGELASDSGSKCKSLRSTGDGFCYRSHCFICGKEATIDSRHPKTWYASRDSDVTK